MNDRTPLDEIRDVLSDRAAPPVPVVMPSGTTRRVRRRRGVRIAGATAMVASLGVLVWLVTAGPAPDGRPQVANRPSLTATPVPTGWPKVELGDPADAFVSVAFDRTLVGDKQPLLAGQVDGSTFSVTAWTADGHDHPGPCLDVTVFAREASPGAVSSGGDPTRAACDSLALTPASLRVDLDTWVLTSPDRPTVRAGLGFTSPRVARLTLTSRGGGEVIELPVLRPAGWNVGAFAFFPPAHGGGTLEAKAADGTVLATAEVCDKGTCNPKPDQLVPFDHAEVGDPADPLVGFYDVLDPLAVPKYVGDHWAEVSFGGDFAPYVDIVDANRSVDGLKHVITYGEVDGARFSLVTYQPRPAADEGPGSCIEFFYDYFQPGTDVAGGSGLCTDPQSDGSVEPGRSMSVGIDWRGDKWDDYRTLVGAVAPQVDHLEITFEDGTAQRVSVLPAAADGTRSVLAFLPVGVAGRVEAVAADGSVLDAIDVPTRPRGAGTSIAASDG